MCSKEANVLIGLFFLTQTVNSLVSFPLPSLMMLMLLLMLLLLLMVVVAVLNAAVLLLLLSIFVCVLFFPQQPHLDIIIYIGNGM